jgi:hypothetical protein
MTTAARRVDLAIDVDHRYANNRDSTASVATIPFDTSTTEGTISSWTAAAKRRWKAGRSPGHSFRTRRR